MKTYDKLPQKCLLVSTFHLFHKFLLRYATRTLGQGVESKLDDDGYVSSLFIQADTVFFGGTITSDTCLRLARTSA